MTEGTGVLQGRVAIVTGGSRGLGFAMAGGLARAGASVVVAARSADAVERAAAGLRASGADAIGVVCDVREESSVASLVTATVERHGRLDILVNNAGINIRKAPDVLSMDEWREVIDTNLTSALLGARAAYPHMKAAGGGKIINLGSMFSRFGASYAAAYAASKAGIVGLTKSLAVAWAPDDIQVNAILPGWIDTDLTRGSREQVPGLAERVVARTPAGRWGRPDDVAGIAVFLASDASDFITGAAIPVDGGYSALG
ncbi:MAG TPA: glucose 1-dehydrogenase [Candidatus Eisenbacteria bacterium]|nr:glucose 1-dehydrogenase [Candidatus Eisenbacteria bacterium]